jgi:hypothetical protein
VIYLQTSGSNNAARQTKGKTMATTTKAALRLALAAAVTNGQKACETAKSLMYHGAATLACHHHIGELQRHGTTGENATFTYGPDERALQAILKASTGLVTLLNRGALIFFAILTATDRGPAKKAANAARTAAHCKAVMQMYGVSTSNHADAARAARYVITNGGTFAAAMKRKATTATAAAERAGQASEQASEDASDTAPTTTATKTAPTWAAVATAANALAGNLPTGRPNVDQTATIRAALNVVAARSGLQATKASKTA